MSPSDTQTPATPPVPRRGLRLTAIVAISVAVLVVAAGLFTRAAQSARLRAWTQQQAIATVAVISPASNADGGTLALPGRLEAYSSAPIYARVGGYLKSWKVDIGAQVKAGQLLAEIDAPDVQQQLIEAQADLKGAQANETLSRATAQRWESMLAKGAVSRQEVEEKTGDLAAKQAATNSAEATVERLRATMAFTRLVAPFDGVVTARNTDIGQLVVASSGSELFVISNVHKLRVYVSVPQSYVPSVKPGTKATLSVPDHPGKSYSATVEASSRAVDASSGTTLMQLTVDNSGGELLPGGYADVHLDLPGGAATLNIPSSALIFDGDGLRVATVGADNRARMKTVTIASDEGKTVAIASGLEASDRVIDSPPDGIADGVEVRVADSAAKSARS
ncbi:MAG: efflux RND transporter periplasmic adaptor subunit [Steroidobacteraceae bacterium]